jgi:hypothetical protein
VVVKTIPGTFVWLEPAFESDFPHVPAPATWISRGQMFIPDISIS